MGILKWVAWEIAREERKREKEERKRRAVIMYNSGYSIDIIANELCVAPSTVRRYIREWRQECKSDYSNNADTENSGIDGLKFLGVFVGAFYLFYKFGFEGGLFFNILLAIFTIFRLSDSLKQREFYVPIFVLFGVLYLYDLNLIYSLLLFVSTILVVVYLSKKLEHS